MRKKVFLVAGLALLLTACGPSESDFKSSDSEGYSACSYYELSDGAGGSVYHENVRQAAQYGALAKTKGIRKYVDTDRPGVPVIRELDRFKKACKKAGYNFK